MYELVLDGSTVSAWFIAFGSVVLLFSLSLIGLWLAIGRCKSRTLALLSGSLCLISICAFSCTTLSPYVYYRRHIEPGIALGERVFQRYEEYKEERGSYPASIGEVYFAELDRFDRVEGVREQSPRCDGVGQGCRAIGVETDGELVVHVHDGLIACQITSLSRQWGCRDQR